MQDAAFVQIIRRLPAHLPDSVIEFVNKPFAVGRRLRQPVTDLSIVDTLSCLGKAFYGIVAGSYQIMQGIQSLFVLGHLTKTRLTGKRDLVVLADPALHEEFVTVFTCLLRSSYRRDVIASRRKDYKMTSRREITLAKESVWLCGMTGNVAGDKKWSESRVQGYGHMPVGAAGRVSIQTKVNTRHEFWLVAADGEERLVEFFDSKVSVREGQTITAIWGARAGQETGPFLMLWNDNSKISNWLIPDPKSLLTRMRLNDPMLMCSLAGIAAALVCAFPFHSWPFAILLGVAGFLVGNQLRRNKAKEIKAAVTEAMNLELKSLAARAQAASVAGEPQRKLAQ